MSMNNLSNIEKLVNTLVKPDKKNTSSDSKLSSNNSNKSTYVDTISALKFDFQPISTVNQINTVSEMINNSNTNNNLLLNLAHIDSFLKNSVEFDDEATSDMS